FPDEALLEAELGGGAADQPLDRLGEEALAGAVGEAESAPCVEREHRDVDLLHDPAEQRVRLERAEPLVAEGLLERVHFAPYRAQDVVALFLPGPQGEVPLAEPGEQVGDDLERT